MNNMKRIKDQKKLKKSAAEEDVRLESMAKSNIEKMSKVVKILPEELTQHPNYENYLLKYGAYTFRINQTKCKQLQGFLLKAL